MYVYTINKIHISIIHMKVLRIILTLVYLFMVSNVLAQPTSPSSNGGFGSNDTVGCSPLIVNFQSIIPGGVSWNWDFGNGNNSTLENPVEMYTNSGLYTVTLDVVYSNGDTYQFIKTDYIDVADKPSSSISVNSFDPCTNTNNLQFTNNTVGATQYLWDFGDGNLSTSSAPNHHYTNSGTYTTTLIATNSQGCSDNTNISNIVIHPVTQNNFQLTGSNQVCDSTHIFPFTQSTNGLTNCIWEFSDGYQHTGHTCQHAFNTYGMYDLLLITEDANGCVDSTYTADIVEINNLAYDFDLSSVSDCELRNIDFTANAASASSISWDFGDGQQATGPLVNHSYSNSGQYTVTMNASHPNGCSQTVVKNNVVEIFSAPTVTSSISDSMVCANESIQFDATNINAQSTIWMYGDGHSSSSPSNSHEYSSPGSFEALLLFSSQGCTDTISHNIIVSQPNVHFTNPPIQNCAPATVSFTDLTPNASSWEWTFSNGTTSTDQNPSVTFNQPGEYDVELIATDINGCSDTTIVVEAFKVLNHMPNNFQPTEFNGCNPISISFYNFVVGNGYWAWDFGDGSSSNNQIPSHTYNDPGNYIVSLSSMDSLGCTMNIDTFAVVHVNSLLIDSINLDLNCNDSMVLFSVDCPSCVTGIWNYGDGNSSTNLNSSYTYSAVDTYNISFTGTSNEGCIASILYNVNLDIDSCTVVKRNWDSTLWIQWCLYHFLKSKNNLQ